MSINFKKNVPAFILYRSRKQVNETSLDVNLLNFRVAEDIVYHDLLEDKISNSREIQSENE
ncbi:2826_t:CDS:2 [Dentiscutata heterogama]|uniref:2826_t:CDS:1 n=1 Tax=Dentiscutata heterogama TaxID=1316150 RepID=A0ACA9MYP8_9GLOM|nr:2826_t:CDS:2 [Dentiscutata heterogama]